jgi:UDP-3-O-[3-hydroxymyristoyl] glucosamine N-acyltransferase
MAKSCKCKGSEPQMRRASIGDTEWALARVHESARVSSDAVIGTPAEWRDRESRHPAIIGEGVVVREFARVHAGAERATVIGDRCLILSGAYVGHDTVMGAGCEIAPNAVVAGCVTLGEGVRVGIGACITPHVEVADGVRIGAGAVVTRDITVPGSTWAGVPARRIA